MKAENGIWKISTGKGNRIYINCIDESKIMHPQELCKMNGLGMYGYEHLKDLAIAILRFEKERQNSESVFYEFETQKNMDKVDIIRKHIGNDDFYDINGTPLLTKILSAMDEYAQQQEYKRGV